MRLRNPGLIVAAALLGLAACADDERPATARAPGAAAAQAGALQYDRPGFWTKVQDGRLWVFRAGSKELEMFQKTGEPARQVTRIGAGPGGITIKSTDASVIDGYLAAR